MKRNFKFVLFPLLFVIILSSFFACNSSDKGEEFTITFKVGEEEYATLLTKGKANITMPNEPIKEDEAFGGWYFDKDNWQQELKANTYAKKSLKEDVTVYARWIAYEQTYYTEGLSFALNGDHYEVSVGDAIAANIVVPSIYNGKSVTKIADEGFCNSHMTYVYIPSSVTVIGNYAFANCEDLISLTIPNSVTILGEGVFAQCNSLTFVTIGGGVGIIGAHAFDLCSSLVEFIVDENNDVFSSQDGIIYNKSKTEIILVPNGKSGVLIIPSTVQTIGDSAFYNCNNLTSIAIPNSVTEIGTATFYGCSKLTSVSIGSSVASIANRAFEQCNSLIEFIVDENNAVLSSQNGIIYSKSKTEIILVPNGLTGTFTIPDNVVTIGENAFSDCSSLTSVVISDSVTTIEDYAFWGCSALTTINIPNNVTSMGESVFYNCSDLTSVTIGNGVESIESTTFYECNSLTSVTMGSGVKELGLGAFGNCTSLVSITIPASVTDIKEGAFNGCSSLTEFIVEEDNADYSSQDGMILNKNKTELVIVAKGLSNAFEIPNSVSIIGERAFDECLNLTSVIIPDSVTKIGAYAFGGCSALTTITIPNSVTDLGYSSTFENCTSLTSVIIGSGVTSIPASAFSNCNSLTSITIGSSVTKIENYAFNNCDSLTSVFYCGTIVSWDSIENKHLLSNATIYYYSETEELGRYWRFVDGVPTVWD